MGPDFRRYRLVPFLGIHIDGVDIEYHPAKGEMPVPNDLTDREFCCRVFHRVAPRMGSGAV